MHRRYAIDTSKIKNELGWKISGDFWFKTRILRINLQKVELPWMKVALYKLLNFL